MLVIRGVSLVSFIGPGVSARYKTLILSTAHPAKFPEIIKDANLELLEIPKGLSDVFNLDEKASHMPASKELIFDFIIKNNL